MQKITPCLWFDTRGEEAATFYASLFKNSGILNVSYYGESGSRPQGSVMTVSFQLDGQEFIALNGGPEYTFNEAVSFHIACASQDEVDHFWDALVEGGEEGPCGWLKDRFGVSWQVVPTILSQLLSDSESGNSQAAMEAMFQMKKLDIETLERAYRDGH